MLIAAVALIFLWFGMIAYALLLVWLAIDKKRFSYFHVPMFAFCLGLAFLGTWLVDCFSRAFTP